MNLYYRADLLFDTAHEQRHFCYWRDVDRLLAFCLMMLTWMIYTWRLFLGKL